MRLRRIKRVKGFKWLLIGAIRNDEFFLPIITSLPSYVEEKKVDEFENKDE